MLDGREVRDARSSPDTRLGLYPCRSVKARLRLGVKGSAGLNPGEVVPIEGDSEGTVIGRGGWAIPCPIT